MKITNQANVMRKPIFLLISVFLFLLLPVFAFSEATVELDKFFFTDDTFVLNDKIGIVNVNSYDEVILDYDSSFVVIRNNTCERIINSKFCVESILFDAPLGSKKAKLVIYDVGPVITLERELNASDVLMGEGVKVDVKIKNDGNTSTDNLTYIDIYPPEIEVMKVIDGLAKIEKIPVWRDDMSAWQNMTMVFWQGKVRAGKEESFTFTLKPVKFIDSSFSARIIYDNGMEYVEEASNSFSLKTKPFFEISKKFAPTDYTVDAGSKSVITGEGKSEVELGEEAIFIAEIKNEARKNATVNVTYIDFYVPPGLLYKGPASFRVYTNISDANASYTPGVHNLKKTGNNLYRWSGFMGPDGLIFAFKVRGIHEGIQKVAVTANLVEFKEKTRPYYEPLYEEDYSDDEELKVKFTDPEIESNFDEGQSFDSGQEAYLTIWMQNQNEFANFTDIAARVDTPWMKKKLAFRSLKKTNYVNFFDGFVKMPEVTSPTTETLYVNATFKTEYGDMYSVKFERNINIKPHAPILISRSLTSSTGLAPGKIFTDNKETFMTLKLTNIANNRIEHINVTEVVDPLLGQKENLTRVVNLDKAVAMDVLKYKIDPPDLRTTEEYNITAYVDYTASNQTFHEVSRISLIISPKKLSLGVTRSAQEDTATAGIPFLMDYIIENEEEEELHNITIIFPLSEDFDIVGKRYYIINRLGKRERMPVIGNEKIRPKINGTSVKLGKAAVIFHDAYGNEFSTNSSTDTIDIFYKPLLSPALMISRNISKTQVNKSERFHVTTTVKNIGSEKIKISISDLGKVWSLNIDPGREKSFTHEISEERTGMIELAPAVAAYTYDGETYYAASNINDINIIEPAIKKAVEVIEIPEEKAAEKVVKKERHYLKYIYLAVFIAIICAIIFSVIKFRPKEEMFEFVKE